SESPTLHVGLLWDSVMAKLTNESFIDAIDKIPWTSWTPSYSSDSGALAGVTTVYAEYLKLGKTLFYTVGITLANSGSGNLRITTPTGLAPAVIAMGMGREFQSAGISLSVLAQTSGSLLVLNYAAGSPAVA